MSTHNVIDIIGTDEAILRGFGVQVFKAIKPDLEKEEVVKLSFTGLKTANFPFFTALIGAVYIGFPDKAEDLLHFEGITEHGWQQDLEEAIYFATNPEKAKHWNASTESNLAH